jgi:hypothetical protein
MPTSQSFLRTELIGDQVEKMMAMYLAFRIAFNFDQT